eukprot:m.218484 g.218484  ORF g.218484 m.218484 type:complete len:712 (-) comp33268_c0_seq2:49-2184(-)
MDQHFVHCWFLSLIGWCVAATVGTPHPTVARVVVYGSTPGGVMSAISAARVLANQTQGTAGWNVTLIDQSKRLGGMCAGGLGSSDIGNPIVIGGLANEFFVQVAQHYNATTHEPLYYLEPHVAEATFAKMLEAAHVTVVRHGRVVSVAKVESRISSITLEDGAVIGDVEAVFVDASYEGDLMARAGVSYTFGREANTTYNETYAGRRQPFGITMDIAHMNPLTSDGQLPHYHPLLTELYAAPLGSADNKVQGYNFRLCVTQNVSNSVPFPKPAVYNRSDWELLFQLAASPTGQTLDRFLNNFGHPLPNGKHDLNNGGIISTDCTGCSWEYPDSNYSTRERIYQHHVNYQQGFLYTLAHDTAIAAGVRAELATYGLCKDEFVTNNNWPEQLYVREARRMVGDDVYTQNDVELNLDYNVSSVGMGSYNFDAHYSHRGPCIANAALDNCEMMTGPAPPNSVIWLGGEGFCGDNHETYQFPIDILFPKREECTNMVNPVTPSTTHVSFATVRMEPQFMILGESAGAVAALTVVSDASFRQSNRQKDLHTTTTSSSPSPLAAVHDVNRTELHAVLTAAHQILSLGTPPPPKSVSYGCVSDLCVALDRHGGDGGDSAWCANTSCHNNTLTPHEWMAMEKDFAPTSKPNASHNYPIATSLYDTFIKKSEVNSQSLPFSQKLRIKNGFKIALACMPKAMEKGYVLFTCLNADCTLPAAL